MGILEYLHTILSIIVCTFVRFLLVIVLAVAFLDFCLASCYLFCVFKLFVICISHSKMN